MPDLSIIIAGVNEWPRIQYTIRAVIEEFSDRADFEIVYVDNFPDRLDQWNQVHDTGHICPKCAEPVVVPKRPDGSWDAIQGAAEHIPELRVMAYRDHLSHWVCKRKAVESSDAKFFLFLDAHVLPGRNALFNQYEYYRQHHEDLNGSLHVPTTYKILDTKPQQYKLGNDLDKGYLGYSFTPYRHPADGRPYTVCAHTTDGCLISRQVYEKFGGWPEIMQAWGGGENLFNFVLSVLGMNKWIFPGPPLYHDGAPRGYSYNWDGLHLVNRLIAMYLIGGHALADLYLQHQSGDTAYNEQTAARILADPEVVAQREHIKRNQVIDIHTWAADWKDQWVK